MPRKIAALVAAVAVVLTGGLTAPAPAGGARADAPLLGSGVQVATASTGIDPATAPPRRTTPVDLEGATAPPKGDAPGSGALAEVVDAVIDGDDVPEELADQVRLDGDRIRVEVTHDDADQARVAVLAAGGRDLVPVTDTVLAADVPAQTIASLEHAPSVSDVALPPLAAAPPEMASLPATVGSNGGDVFGKTRMAQWHSVGVNGSGISVGIVDYFAQSAWPDAQRRGEVPAPAGTFCRQNGEACSIFSMPTPTGLHGVAVAEAIHDMAPRSKIYLATVSTGEDLRKAIDYFASKGVRILSRSLGGFFDGPGNGSGPSAALVDYAVSRGITWFNSAGNAGAYTQTYADGSKDWVGGYWRQTWRDTDGDGWMEFALYDVDPVTGTRTATPRYAETMPIACSPYFRLRWSDWGRSVPTDYDIYRVVDGQIQAPGYEPGYQSAVGDKPLELQDGSSSYFRCTPGEWIEIAIEMFAPGGGTAGDVLELQGNSADIAWGATSVSSAGQAFADSRNPGMATVGAVDPVAGTQIAGYSAWGPTNDGRVKPELSAGSNFTSRAYAAGGYGGRFNGTSAATPVVAGAAAVALQRFVTKTPAELVSYLRTGHTTDRGAAGIDNVYGSGELIMRPLRVVAFSSTATPKIVGTRAVGATLTVAKPAWRPAASFTYQWYRGAKPIAGATRASYRLTAADGGQRIRVLATGSRGGYSTVKKFSGSTGAILRAFSKKPTPKIAGTATVGRTLTATVGTWSPKPSKVTYQWKRNGATIRGATKKTYTLTSKDAGTRITVTVKAVRTGYLATAKTSGKTAIVKKR